MHNKVEGTLSYINLLFIPGSRPFDLFQMDVKSKIKLYSNRVLITDDSESILPRWLRFVKGIVDTSDVDLNVSREMLQHNVTLNKISKALKKRVINEWKTLKDKDTDKYQSFWNEFGIVLKEGIYEDFDLKTELLELSKFQSMNEDKPVFLSDYIEKMNSEQKDIYYIAAENKDMAEGSPHLEVFKKKKLDVLFLTDPIDTFWLSMAAEFQDRKFVSITKGDIDLSAFSDDKKEKEEIDIRMYSIIYDAINDLKDAMEGMLSPDFKEEITGSAEIRETFKISKIGTIAGCMVTNGKIYRSSKIRVIRDSVIIYTGRWYLGC